MKMNKSSLETVNLKIGGHVSAAGELGLAVDRAVDIGANTFQFFVSPPQQWLQTNHSDAEIADFVQKAKEKGIDTTFIHGTYLVNLATAKPEHLEKSIAWLKYALELAQKLGVTGIIFHTGSHSGRGFETAVDQIANSLNVIFARFAEDSARRARERSERVQNPTNQDSGVRTKVLPQNDNLPYLILENSAGGGGSIGSKFKELGEILKKANNPRIKICLDTCHGFAAGYDVKTKEGLERTLAEFDKEIGLENLVAIHANDTKFDLGSGKDRHENIGEGFIGKEGFSNLINNEHLKNVPFILEVPGFTGAGPDRENIDILKSLVH